MDTTKSHVFSPICPPPQKYILTTCALTVCNTGNSKSVRFLLWVYFRRALKCSQLKQHVSKQGWSSSLDLNIYANRKLHSLVRYKFGLFDS